MKTEYRGNVTFLGHASEILACGDRATLKMRLKNAFVALVNEHADYMKADDCDCGEMEIAWIERNKLSREVGSHRYGNWTFTVTELKTIGSIK